MIAKIQDNKVCYMSWPTTRTWQWRSVKNDTLRQKRWFEFSNYKLLISV